MEKKFLERFMKKNCKKQIRKCLRQKTVKEKVITFMLSGKVMINSWIDKKDIVQILNKKSQYFSKP